MSDDAHAPLRSSKALFIICAACAGWAFSFGVSAPLAALWLEAAGCSDVVIGWNGGVHYLGLALAALANTGLNAFAGFEETKPRVLVG